MLIRMIKTEASASGCFVAGQKYDLDKPVAEKKIEDGLAVFVKETERDSASRKAGKVETATAKPAENAAKQNNRDKGRS